MVAILEATKLKKRRFFLPSFLFSFTVASSWLYGSSGDQQLLSTTDYLQIERMGYSADLWAHFAYSIALCDPPPPLLLWRAKGRSKRRRRRKKGTWDRSSSRPWRVGGKLLLPPEELACLLFFLSSSTVAVIYNWGASFHRHDDSTATENAAPSVVCNIDSGSSSSEIAKPSGGGRGTMYYMLTSPYTYVFFTMVVLLYC